MIVNKRKVFFPNQIEAKYQQSKLVVELYHIYKTKNIDLVVVL